MALRLRDAEHDAEVVSSLLTPAPDVGPRMSTQPHSVQAEQSVVGTLLAKPAAVGEVIGTLLEPAHFHIPAYRALYHEIVSAYYADDPIDALTIGELCSKTLSRSWGCSEQEAVVQVQALAAGQSSFAKEAVNHARVIKRHHDYRALLELAASIQRKVELESASPDELAADASHEAMRIATSTLLTHELVTFEELGRRFVREQQTLMAAAAAGIEIGVYFGLPFLDSYMRGLRPSDLWFLAGEPGAGKSAVSWVAAQRFAERQLRKPRERWVSTLVLSLEMAETSSGGRFAQSIAGIDGAKLREGRTDEADLRKLVAEWKRRKDLPLLLNFSSNMRLSQLRAVVIEAIRRHNVGLVVIDHWKYLDSDRQFRNTNDEDEAKARFLKQDLAKQLNVAVVCLAHTTKGADQREDRRPRMNDLRGSGFVAAHADFISFVHRPYKHATAADIEEGRVHRTDAEMLWEKTRHSVEGAANFHFDPSTMTVR